MKSCDISPEMFYRLFIQVCQQWCNTFCREILAEERNRQVEEMKRDNRRIQEINWSKFFYSIALNNFTGILFIIK